MSNTSKTINPPQSTTGDKEKFRETVRQFYTDVAEDKKQVHEPQNVTLSLGYDQQQLSTLPEGADMGLGCGNPLALGKPAEGDRMIDLGCGRGIDVYLALPLLGPKGYAIGIDNNPKMLEGAKKLAQKKGGALEFRLGELDQVPVEDNWATLITSNCAINLCPNKQKVYQEIARLLCEGGRVSVSDITLSSPLPPWVLNDPKYWGT